jgi:stress-induced morphogen
MDLEQIRRKISEAIPGARVQVRDLTGTGDHFEVFVASGAFAGKTRLEQHRMIYAALGTDMAGPIHALAIRTEVGT